MKERKEERAGGRVSERESRIEKKHVSVVQSVEKAGICVYISSHVGICSSVSICLSQLTLLFVVHVTIFDGLLVSNDRTS